MKIGFGLLLAAIVLLIAGKVFSASDDRFNGASFDGYASRSFIQLLDQARFRGASRDGYDKNQKNGEQVPVLYGAVYTFR